MKLLVVYSRAHTTPNGSPGTSTPKHTTERTVAKAAQYGLEKVICNAGGKVVMVQGTLSGKIGMANREIKRMQKDGYKWVSVELHMNNTGPEVCAKCGTAGVLGIKCRSCGERSRVPSWKWGHKNMVLEACPQAVDLSTYVDAEISNMLPTSKARPPLMSPCRNDRFVTNVKRVVNRQGKMVKRSTIIQPAILVEAGFACLPAFADFIDRPENQAEYGERVARAIIKWYDANERISLDDWGKIEPPIMIRS